MMFDFNYNPIGKTLAEVAKETKPDHYSGYTESKLVLIFLFSIMKSSPVNLADGLKKKKTFLKMALLG